MEWFDRAEGHDAVYVLLGFSFGLVVFVPLFYMTLFCGVGSRVMGAAQWDELPLNKQQAAGTAICGLVHSLILSLIHI